MRLSIRATYVKKIFSRNRCGGQSDILSAFGWRRVVGNNNQHITPDSLFSRSYYIFLTYALFLPVGFAVALHYSFSAYYIWEFVYVCYLYKKLDIICNNKPKMVFNFYSQLRNWCWIAPVIIVVPSRAGFGWIQTIDTCWLDRTGRATR